MSTVEVHPGLAPSWPALADPGPLFASPGWLRAMDGRLGPSTYTFLVRDKGRAVLAALGSVHADPRPGEFFDLHHVLVSAAAALPLTPSARARRAELSATAPDAARFLPALVMMLPGYECAPVGDPGYTTDLVDGVRDWATGRGLSTVAWLYLRPDATALCDALDSRGFDRVPLSVTWDLPVPASGLPGYLARLPRKRRTETRRELNRLADAGLAVGPLDADRITAELDRLVELRCQLVQRYRGGADPAVERRRLRLLVDDVCGGRPAVVVAAAGREVLSFALFAAWHGDWHCLAVGSDYTDPLSRWGYFATAYYGGVRAAAEAGVRRIGYGQGSPGAKRARGCVGTELSGYVFSADLEVAAAVRASAAVTALRA